MRRRLLGLVLLCATGCAGTEQAEERSGRRVEVARPTTQSASTATAPEAEAEPQPEPEPDPVAALMAMEGSVSTSIGGPNNGRLEGGVPLPDEAPGLRSNPRRPNANAHYGTVEVIQAIVRAAAVVAEEFEGSELVINDISFEEGGPIPHHGSHQAGRDVDSLFYLLDREGNPIRSKGIPIDPQGRGWDFGDLSDPSDDVPVRIDIPRTWRFVQALLEDDTVAINRIYVVEHIRAMLLEHAERIGAPSEARRLFGLVTCQPGAPHDDHLHIRFFCTPEDIAAGCQDAPPLYYWHRNAMAEFGVEPVLEVRDRDHDRAVRRRIVSRRQARERAEQRTRMHWRVRRFLEERDRWAKKPHPGRPYCR